MARITNFAPFALVLGCFSLVACAGQPHKWGAAAPASADNAPSAPAETTNASVEPKSSAADADADVTCERAACIPLCTKAGNPTACKEAGYALRDGSGIEADFARAAAAFDRACKKKERYSCHELGKAYMVGEGVPTDPAKGIALHQIACDLGVGQACDDLAKLYEKGEAVAQDHPRAIEFLVQGCLAEDYQVWTCNSLRRFADKKDKLATKVLADWKKACAKKDATACRGNERITPKDANANAKDAKSAKK